MLVAQDSKPSTMEEQVALLEKSYELAAKYQNDNNAGQAAQPDETGGSVSTGEKSMKAEPVSDVRRTVVSALPQPMTDSAFIADYSGERNYGSTPPSVRRKRRGRTPSPPVCRATRR